MKWGKAIYIEVLFRGRIWPNLVFGENSFLYIPSIIVQPLCLSILHTIHAATGERCAASDEVFSNLPISLLFLLINMIEIVVRRDVAHFVALSDCSDAFLYPFLSLSTDAWWIMHDGYVSLWLPRSSGKFSSYVSVFSASCASQSLFSPAGTSAERPKRCPNV